MTKKAISYRVIINMLREGLDNLYEFKDYVNSLNVFPVPDGDTGSNMYITLKDALNLGENNKYDKETLKIVSNNAIYSSRGNSGTILAMFIKGFFDNIPDGENISHKDFVKSFSEGCKSARKCLDKPVEGTIITVMDETSKEMLTSMKYRDTLGQILQNGLKKAKVTLTKTPEMLPILKKAGVVDAGGQGFIYILEGMSNEYSNIYSQSEYRESMGKLSIVVFGIHRNINRKLSNVTANISIDNLKSIYNGLKLPDITSVWKRKIEFKYDVEFIINTTGKEKEIHSLLRKYGDSIIIVETDVATKVHIHTNQPDDVFNEVSSRIGEIRNGMVEDMAQQRNNVVADMQKGYEIIVLIKNYGFESLIKGFNINKVFNVNSPSVNEIIKLINIIDHNKIVFLVSDKNLEIVTKQAISNAKKVGTVLAFKNEAYLLNSLMNFNRGDSYEDVIEKLQIENGFKSANITISAKVCKFDGINLDKGDYISILDNSIIATSKDIKQCILNTLVKLKTEFSSLATIYISSEYISKEMIDKIQTENSDLEFDIYDIGKSNFIAIISVE
jgi:DAK2 domain fusion protein YloV